MGDGVLATQTFDGKNAGGHLLQVAYLHRARRQ
jgi:hypothetical protein